MVELKSSDHRCTVMSWRKWYRWPILWVLHLVTGTSGFRCKTCGYEVMWRPRSKRPAIYTAGLKLTSEDVAAITSNPEESGNSHG